MDLTPGQLQANLTQTPDGTGQLDECANNSTIAQAHAKRGCALQSDHIANSKIPHLYIAQPSEQDWILSQNAVLGPINGFGQSRLHCAVRRRVELSFRHCRKLSLKVWPVGLTLCLKNQCGLQNLGSWLANVLLHRNSSTSNWARVNVGKRDRALSFGEALIFFGRLGSLFLLAATR